MKPVPLFSLVVNPTMSEGNPNLLAGKNQVTTMEDSLDSAIVLGSDDCEKKSKWTRFDAVIVDGDVSRSNVLTEYALGSAGCRRPSNVLKEKARKYLSYLGWKIEIMNKDRTRFRYTSPEGKAYPSLRHVCVDLGEPPDGTDSRFSQYGQRTLCSSNSHMSEHEKTDASTAIRIDYQSLQDNDILHIVGEYCPQALTDYYSLGLDKKDHRRKGGLTSHLIAKARKHLSCMGWVFQYAYKNGKRELHYCSPKGRYYYSLRTACKACMDEGGASEATSSRGIKRHEGPHYNVSSCLQHHAQNNGALAIVNDVEGNYFNHGLQSRKSACQVPAEESSQGIGLQSNNDNICSVCQYGGNLVLCDQCPSSFHKSCIGLKELPRGNWFCPSCCCTICGVKKFEEYSEEDNSFSSCKQCELQYHVGCLRKQTHLKFETYPDETWFCSTKCEKIFMGLQKLLGKPIPVGVDDLTWTLLKPTICKRCDTDASDINAPIEIHKKLNIALNIMHEYFEPVKGPYMGKDLVEDVIFCRGSNLRHLNFQGFYTVLLERNNELISVATIRVYGEKVAEIPLVGTQSQYQQQEMCQILINEIEKMLMNFGVERMTLTAAPGFLDTLVSSAGFSKITDSERLRFRDYTFLNFQGTVMWQKLLVKNLVTKSSRPTAPWLNHDAEFDRQSVESEVLQAEQVEEVRTLAEETDTTSGDGFGDSTTSSATQQNDFECDWCLDEDMVMWLLGDDNHDGNSLEGLLKDDDQDGRKLAKDDWDKNIVESLLKNGKSEEQCFQGMRHVDNENEHCSESMLQDNIDNQHSFMVFIKDDNDDGHCSESMFRDDIDDQHSFEDFLNYDNDDEQCFEEDNHKTSRENGDGDYRCSKRRRT